MRKYSLVLFSMFLVILSSCDWALSKSESNSTEKVFSRSAIEKQAKRLVETGYLDEAIEKFREAIQPQYISYEHEKALSLGSIVDIYRLKGEYDSALKELEWFFLNNAQKTPPSSLSERKAELIALRQYQQTKNSKFILDFLTKYIMSHEKNLPPNRYVFSSPIYISTILRLYDTIGDYDAGIAFIDEILAYFRTGKAGDPKPGKVDAEYMKVREAFELDKKEGRKGSMKEGRPGRATLQLIQSDYFPW